MRIIGGKDYYDHGLAYGLDPSIVFNRVGRSLSETDLAVRRTGGLYKIEIPKEKKIRLGWWKMAPSSKREWTHAGREYHANSVHLIFCGHYYHGVQIRSINMNAAGKDIHHTYAPGDFARNRPKPYRHWDSETFWDQNSVAHALAKAGVRLVLPDARKRNAVLGAPYKMCERRKLTESEMKSVLDHGITVAVLNGDETVELSRNGMMQNFSVWKIDGDFLKDFQFIKVLDPVQAFQKISMWVGGVLPKPGNPMVQITDDSVKIAKHGMDKTSFRRPPQKKKA